MAIGTVGDIINDMENGIYDFTVNGECSNCGECCSAILPMNQKEIDRIKKYVKNHNIKPIKHTVLFNEDIVDFTCPFLDKSKEKKCTIYPVRPDICRVFNCNVPPSKAAFDKKKYEKTKGICDMWKVFGDGEGIFDRLFCKG